MRGVIFSILAVVGTSSQCQDDSFCYENSPDAGLQLALVQRHASRTKDFVQACVDDSFCQNFPANERCQSDLGVEGFCPASCGGCKTYMQNLDTNVCPLGQSRITDQSGCQVAAHRMGLNYKDGSYSFDFLPAGCFGMSETDLAWNKHPTGKAYPPGNYNSGGLVCAQVSTAAPTTEAPTAAPTESPTEFPTQPVTAGPTTEASTAASAVGDPHLVNTLGEHFSLYKSGQVEFIRVPYESVTEKADLTVHATIQSYGETDKCNEGLYITGLRFDGSWFKGKPLEVNVDFIRPGSTQKEMKVLLGGVPVVPSTDPIDVGDKTALHMHDNKKVVLMVDGASVVVDQQYFFLNVEADSFSSLSQRIGGLLGEDDHAAFSTKPAGCEQLLAKGAWTVYSSASMSA